MAYVRLTNDMRDSVIRRLIVHRFSEQVRDLTRRQAEHAQAVYEAAFSEADRKRMAALPDGWLPKATDIRFTIGDGSSRLVETSFDGRAGMYGDLAKARGLSEDDDRRDTTRLVPYSKKGQVALIMEIDNPLAARWEELTAERSDLAKQICDAEKVAKGAIYSVTTVGALVNNWPEVKPFVQKWLEEPPAPLPALPTARLNAMLGLPVETAPAGKEHEDA